MWHRPVRLILLLFAVTVPVAGGETVHVQDSAQLRAAVAEASPGTVISLAPGVYAPGVRMVGLAGTKDRPIVIEGGDPEHPPAFRGGSCALHLVDCCYVTLRNVTVSGCSGNGVNVDDGGSIETPSHHVVIERVTILDTGPRGNHDALKLSGVEDFAIRDCRIAGWGGSAIDMVGCHRGVVEGGTFEGKPGFSQSNGIQIKGGSRAIRVHLCSFRDAGQRSINVGGSTGPAYFRPKDARFEAEDITVAGNRFQGSGAVIACVNSRNARVHHNTMYLPAKWVLRILQETTAERFPACRDGVLEDNLIVYDGGLRTAVNIGPGTAPATFALRRNAWFGVDGAAAPSVAIPETGAIHGVDPELAQVGTHAMRATAKDKRLGAVGARAYKP